MATRRGLRRNGRRVVLLAAGLWLLITAPLARADGLADQLSGLTDPDPKPAIQSLLSTDDAKAKAVLRAPADGRLCVRRADGVIVIGDRSGNNVRLTVAATMEPDGVVAPAEIEPVVINNNLRNVVREAVGRLGLVSPDAAQRRAAADALLENAGTEAASLLAQAYPKATNSAAKATMQTALP